MAALFNELGGPHVTLAGTQPLAEGLQDEQLARLLGEPTWQLDIALELEEYGPGSGRLLAG
jgi:hypothetical protein